MKKLMAGLLMTVMCFAVTGCGSSEEEKLYEKYKTLIDALEEEDYVTAVGQIYAMAQGGSKEQENEYEEAMKAVSYGDWCPSPYDAENGVQAFSISEDGTCQINGETLNWIVDNAGEDYIRLVVNSQDVKKYEISVNKNTSENYYYGYLYSCDENGTGTNVGGQYYRAADYTVTEVNMDNFGEYFEFVEIPYFNENAFGEVDEFQLRRYYLLKEEYRDKVRSDISEVAVEYQYTSATRTCKVDVENKTYELGDIVDTWDTNTSMPSLYEMGLGNDTYVYGFEVGSIWMSTLPESNVSTREDISILRLQGKLYMINE